MSLLLYGMIGSGETIQVPGVNLVLISGGGLIAIATQIDHVEQDIESVLTFGAVIECIHRQTTIIPIRFGTQLPDSAAISNYLSAMAGHYQSRLAALAGCEEMGIRLPMETDFTDHGPPVSNSSGRDYLLSLKRKYSTTERAERQVEALNDTLAGLYRDQRGEAGWFNNKPMYLVSYLVPRTTLPAFRQKLDELVRTGVCPGSISGPWPPYNFT
ncbi:MAG: GvpL/GvpF family gas vesicle protein [Methylococcus sp.]